MRYSGSTNTLGHIDKCIKMWDQIEIYDIKSRSKSH